MLLFPTPTWPPVPSIPRKRYEGTRTNDRPRGGTSHFALVTQRPVQGPHSYALKLTPHSTREPGKEGFSSRKVRTEYASSPWGHQTFFSCFSYLVWARALAEVCVE
jgi:hypothetical protein